MAVERRSNETLLLLPFQGAGNGEERREQICLTPTTTAHEATLLCHPNCPSVPHAHASEHIMKEEDVEGLTVCRG